MPALLRLSLFAALLLTALSVSCLAKDLPEAQRSPAPQRIVMPRYTAEIAPGNPPRLTILRENQPVFVVPIVSGLASSAQEEQLSAIDYSLKEVYNNRWQLTATAKSSLWTNRRFEWTFSDEFIAFQQFADGQGKLGRCYFLSNGVSNRWDNGTTPGHDWDATIYADRYFSPSPNHANQFEFNIAMPQILGFSVDREPQSEQDFRPERLTGLFAPPPLFLAFHHSSDGSETDKTWTGIGIGTRPGTYQFPALEYTGSRYAGASFFVDYMGYKAIDDGFTSPTLTFSFAYDPLDALQSYAQLEAVYGSFGPNLPADVPWHHLPIFCGWAEQTVESVPQGKAPNTMATQANYEKWLAVVEERKLPVGTVVIDDKWQKGYGTFEVDSQKWPDMKGFVAAQHAKGRHVLLWVPVAHTDGLPEDLCVKVEGKCVVADVGKPAYESYLRPRIRHLVEDFGVDGFKEDWVGAPAVPGLPLTGPATGIEFVRRFQWILYSETHKWKPDAMVETQTTNALFRESSDVIRLNDIWYGTRNVADVLRLRARIAHISGWSLVDTDNASSTTLQDWWSYMQAQPTIGIPALYFVTRTESTQESPSQEQWEALSGLWRSYIDKLKAEP